MNREDLEARLDEVQQNISIEKQRGPEKNAEQIAIWEQEEADILAQMDQLEKQAVSEQINQAHTDRVTAASQEIASILDTIEFEGMSMRQLCAGEPQYQALRILAQQAYQDQAQKYSDQLRAAEEREAQLKRQNDILQQRINQSETEKLQLQTELNDRESKLQAATSEIDRLNSQVDDLRKEIAVGARSAVKVQDVDQLTQLRNLAAEIKASLIPIYDKKEMDFKGTRYSAKLAKSGEEIEFSYLESPKYYEVTPEQVLDFRRQYEAEQAELAAQNDTNDQPLAEPEQGHVTGEQFQTTDEVPPVLPDVQAPTVDREVASEAGTDAVSREEVDARFKRIEEHLGLKSWRYDGEVA
jgi:hypothetical protein